MFCFVISLLFANVTLVQVLVEQVKEYPFNKIRHARDEIVLSS